MFSLTLGYFELFLKLSNGKKRKILNKNDIWKQKMLNMLNNETFHLNMFKPNVSTLLIFPPFLAKISGESELSSQTMLAILLLIRKKRLSSN